MNCKEQYYLKNYNTEDTIKICALCPEGCKHCLGYTVGEEQKYNCSECIPGYILNNNSLFEKQCDVGENNLCLNYNITEKNKCYTCNIGYYLAIDVEDKSKCLPCTSNCTYFFGTVSESTCQVGEEGFKIRDG